MTVVGVLVTRITLFVTTLGVTEDISFVGVDDRVSEAMVSEGIVVFVDFIITFFTLEVELRPELRVVSVDVFLAVDVGLD